MPTEPLLNVQHDAREDGPVRSGRQRVTVLTLAMAMLAMAGCSGAIYYPGIKIYYRGAPAAAQTLRDIPYVPNGGHKQQLDLFLPAATARPWPVVIFVHGGSWASGDRDLRVAGADVYGNVGRYLAAHGFGAAVISYRLQPEVNWKAQAADVVAATAWVHAHIAEHGGNSNDIFMMGHSAGAELAVRTALDTAALASAGVPASAIAGVIGVSGAGYDLTDARTYTLGNDPAWYAKVFKLSPSDTDWQQEGSITPMITRQSPPFLLMYAGGETRPLQRQTQLLDEKLRANGVASRLVVPDGMSHTRILLTISREDKTGGAAILDFIRDQAAQAH